MFEYVWIYCGVSLIACGAIKLTVGVKRLLHYIKVLNRLTPIPAIVVSTTDTTKLRYSMEFNGEELEDWELSMDDICGFNNGIDQYGLFSMFAPVLIRPRRLTSGTEFMAFVDWKRPEVRCRDRRVPFFGVVSFFIIGAIAIACGIWMVS